MASDGIDWASEAGQRLNAVCNRFEAACKDGMPVRLEDFLQGWQEPERTVLLQELIALEVYHRRRRGLDCPKEEVLGRFPGLDAAWLSALLDPQERTGDAMETAAGPLAGADRGAGVCTAAGGSNPAARYLLGEEIARGGMAVIHRATDSVLGREVAVKVLQEKYEPDSDMARRFADEARITGQLQHPNIPAVHDLGTLPNGQPFLAMKLIRGETLEALLKRGLRPRP
jgi:hypothetical protein